MTFEAVAERLNDMGYRVANGNEFTGYTARSAGDEAIYISKYNETEKLPAIFDKGNSIYKLIPTGWIVYMLI